MKKLVIPCVLAILFGCQEKMETYQLEVHVESGVSGFSLEGYEVAIYNTFPPTVSTIDDKGKTYFEVEAQEGEQFLVEFQANGENFNPQGVGATERSEIWEKEKQSERIRVGQQCFVDLLVIPSTRINVDFINDVPMPGDSLSLKLTHELFCSDITISGNRSRFNLSYSAPIGEYTYEGTLYTLNDTTPMKGSFTVPHQDFFSHEIRY